jgi:Ca2+-binding RTX toxin-like protein
LTGIENLVGSDGADALGGNAQANGLHGRAGDDTLWGGIGADTLDGGTGTDTATYIESAAGVNVNLLTGTGSGGTAQDDTLTEVENLIGSFFGDVLTGNDESNLLLGGFGADTLAGNDGDDTYAVDNAADTVTESGGRGIDTVLASGSYALTAGADVELLAAANPNGTAALNLTGNATGNIVRGNAGNNVIGGGGGNDELTGRGGQDSFLFDAALDATFNVDVITDFNVADDTILLDQTIFSSSLGLGNISDGELVIGTAALDANDRIIYDNINGALYYDNDGAGGNAATQFAVLSPGLALTNLDFLVVA